MTLRRLPTCRKALSLKARVVTRRRGACPPEGARARLLWIRGFEPNRTAEALQPPGKSGLSPSMLAVRRSPDEPTGRTIKLSPNAKAPAVSDRTWPERTPDSARGETEPPAYPPPNPGAFRTLTQAEAEFLWTQREIGRPETVRRQIVSTIGPCGQASDNSLQDMESFQTRNVARRARKQRWSAAGKNVFKRNLPPLPRGATTIILKLSSDAIKFAPPDNPNQCWAIAMVPGSTFTPGPMVEDRATRWI